MWGVSAIDAVGLIGVGDGDALAEAGEVAVVLRVEVEHGLVESVVLLLGEDVVEDVVGLVPPIDASGVLLLQDEVSERVLALCVDGVGDVGAEGVAVQRDEELP
jgi:hypothetical protein